VPRAFPEEVAGAGADDGMAGYVDTNAPEQVHVSLGVQPGPPPVDVEEDEGLGAGEAGERELVVRDHPFPDPRPDSGAPGQGPPTEGGVLREICRHEPGAGRIHCSSPSTSIFIFYDGRVLPCCHPHAHASMTMGNLMTQSFQEIWNGRLYRNLRAGLFTGDAPPLCRKCSIVHSPPPVVEDPQELIGPGRDLCSYYAGRDLASDEAPDAAWVIETLQDPWGNLEHERDAQQGHIRTLERERAAQRGHIRNLERILDKIHGIPIYRFLGRIKSIFVKKAPE
jgi:radical SAM protein with 4Fe4S-binding SPASM domain